MSSSGSMEESTNAESSAGAQSLAKLTEDALLDQLGQSIEHETASATFGCGGILPINSEGECGDAQKSSDLVVLLWDHRQDAGQQSECNKIVFPLSSRKEGSGEKDLLRLFDCCHPATFGRGKEDVYDENYRKAVALDEKEFSTNFNPYSLGIVDVISKVLLPSVPRVDDNLRGIDARLYKLNIYSGPSGMFHAHVDTLRSEKQFGSLVVCLPVAHEGGQLLVRHHGNTLEFDWGNNDSDHLHWCAFYSDCEHEVKQVQLGHRITLTYNLFVSEGNASAAMNPKLLPLHSTINSLLQNAGFMRQGGILGIHCSHAYAHTTQGTIEHLPHKLKGADAAIYAVRKNLDLNVNLRPVIGNEFTKYFYWPEHYGPTEHYEGPPVKGESYRNRDARTRLRWQRGIGKTIVGTALHPLAFTSVGGDEGDKYYEPYDAWHKGLQYVSTNLTSEELAAKTNLNRANDEDPEYPYSFEEIRWITHPKHKQPAIAHLAYGNNVEMRVKYSSAALLIDIPTFTDRT